MSEAGESEIRGVDFVRRVRKFGRNKVNLAAKIEIHYEDGPLFTTGTAVVRDMSVKGARLGKIVLRRQLLPAQPFWIHLTFEDPQYAGIGAVCKPVRFGPGREFELGIEFDNFWVKEDPNSKSTARFQKS
jgi:hypothetical protein